MHLGHHIAYPEPYPQLAKKIAEVMRFDFSLLRCIVLLKINLLGQHLLGCTLSLLCSSTAHLEIVPGNYFLHYFHTDFKHTCIVQCFPGVCGTCLFILKVQASVKSLAKHF